MSKIFHIIIDGYSPNNEDDYFKNGFEELFQDYDKNSVVKHNPDEGHMSGRPHSPDMWTRAYSKTSFADVKEEGDSARLGPTTKINRIPSKNFIWNKLGSKGIDSWIYPFGQYYRLVHRNMIQHSVKDHINGVAKYYGTNQSARISKGKVEWYKGDYTYWGMHETAWGREKVKGDKIFGKYYENWKNMTPEFEKIMVQECYEYYKNSLIPMMNEDKILFETDILPHFDKTLKNSDNLQYVHVGLVEADTLYHFTPLYSDINTVLYDYYKFIISHILDVYKPEIVILTGDHGMERPWISPRRKAKGKVTWNGITRDVVQSQWGVAPLYNDHSWSIGCDVYTKVSSSIFDNIKDGNETYLMYDIYDSILSELCD